MVGQGSLAPLIHQYIKKYHLSSIVKIAPPTTDTGRYYTAAKMLLITSEHEGFPLTILESFAYHTPVLVNKIPEISSFFNKYPGRLIFSDPKDAVDKIIYLLSHPGVTVKIADYYSHKVTFRQTQNFSLFTQFLKSQL